MYHEVLFLNVAKFPPSLAQQGSFYNAKRNTMQAVHKGVDARIEYKKQNYMLNYWPVLFHELNWRRRNTILFGIQVKI